MRVALAATRKPHIYYTTQNRKRQEKGENYYLSTKDKQPANGQTQSE
nr:MAG TPA: hypothetical protein [Caudoviricetes sp.]